MLALVGTSFVLGQTQLMDKPITGHTKTGTNQRQDIQRQGQTQDRINPRQDNPKTGTNQRQLTNPRQDKPQLPRQLDKPNFQETFFVQQHLLIRKPAKD